MASYGPAEPAVEVVEALIADPVVVVHGRVADVDLIVATGAAAGRPGRTTPKAGS